MINNFLKSIPKEFNPHLISSKMSRDFQQEGWHPLSHVAVVINYQDPENCDDNGVILLDPNFDIPIPLIFNNFINGCSIYMGPKRGTWHFKFDKDKSTIICQSKKNDNIDEMVFYLGYSVTNPHIFALRPMIATDRSLSIVSRDRQGRHIAHLKLNLEKRTITRSVNGSYLPIQTFDQFLNKPFDKSYCEKLNLEVNELNSAVRKVINHQDVLLKLRKEYLNNI